MSGEMNPAAVSSPVEDSQGDARWMSQHERFVQECKDAEPDVLFIGDSMIQLMQQHEVWKDLFSPLHALNFGLAGDTTCNVLWRIQNGELRNIKPKVVVLWVGTNNHQHTAEQVAGGVKTITQFLIAQLPHVRIIVLGLLPRGERQNPLREKNAAVNELLCSWVPQLGPVHFLDLSAEFLHSDGTISKQDMFDFLHLTAAGYRTLSKPLHDLLLQFCHQETWQLNLPKTELLVILSNPNHNPLQDGKKLTTSYILRNTEYLGPVGLSCTTLGNSDPSYQSTLHKSLSKL